MYVGVRAGGGIGDEIEDPAGDEFEVERIVFDITFFFFVIVILLAIIQGESRCLFQGSVWPRHTVLTSSSHTNATNLFQAWSSMPSESCVTSKSRWKKIWRWVWLTRNPCWELFIRVQTCVTCFMNLDCDWPQKSGENVKYLPQRASSLSSSPPLMCVSQPLDCEGCVRFRGKKWINGSFSWNFSVCVQRLACVHKIKWTHLAASPETIVLTALMSCGSDLVLLQRMNPSAPWLWNRCDHNPTEAKHFALIKVISLFPVCLLTGIPARAHARSPAYFVVFILSLQQEKAQ